ncbi:Carnosine N-methyltransferase [Schistosoma japonicum]|nr:Carnosine N-methyltransferase [Schistosoma japonicum]
MEETDEQLKEAAEMDHHHFVKTLAAFKFFGPHLLKRVERSRAYYHSLPPAHHKLIREFDENLKNIEQCISHNNDLIVNIIKHSAPDIFNGEHAYELNPNVTPNGKDLNDGQTVPVKEKFGPFAFTDTEMDKVRSALKQFVRDWSVEGKPERDICYQFVIDDVLELFNPKKINPADVNILVPGAGLGRLAWELAHHGYTCQGNEWSLYMLIPAYFILNTCKQINEYKLYPWVAQFCNNMSREDQMSPVYFPDVYTWDCIATVFFIDTAHNILNYLDTIWSILKPGGYWINFGPLLYHFSDIPGEDSLELSYSELRLAIKRLGFEILREETGIQCGYTQNPSSMLSYNYNCVYGLFRKPLTEVSTPTIISESTTVKESE